ncbi:MAG TPA: hypothetical protein VM450_08605 [Thermomicrobiales bacterium]|nr:hypothetical protein [Thermomicrobiales bacterium]
MDLTLTRRTFLAGSLAITSTLALRSPSLAQPFAVPSHTRTELLELALTLTDSGFELAHPLIAGRYHVTVKNNGTSPVSHFGFGKIPDRITDAQYEEWLQSIGTDKERTDILAFEDIAFVGVPDWPPPGGSASGVVDIAPGRYLLFDPIGDRGATTVMVDGQPVDAVEPASDLTVTLREMQINLPDAAFTTAPVRWKIENTGTMSHEVAIVPVDPAFTEDDLKLLFSLPEDATPPPGVPAFDYQPVAAIGILAPGHTSWLDVQLKPGHYLGACMLPFSTGYPHAMDGMYAFFDVA